MATWRQWFSEAVTEVRQELKELFSELLIWVGWLPIDSKIVFLGLDNAGKTTLLSMLKLGRMKQNSPTTNPYAEELLVGKRRFRTFDMGGHETARRLWKDYCLDADGVIFIVDAADRSRLDECRNELQRLLQWQTLKHVPIVVLGNKIDRPEACSEEDLRYALGIPQKDYTHTPEDFVPRDGKNGAPIEVFMVSILKKMGYDAAFKWLCAYLKHRDDQEDEYDE